MRSLKETVIGEEAIPQQVIDFINLILENFNPMTDELALCTDEQLQRLTMPVLFIAGEQDTTIDAQSAARRISEIAPRTQAHLLKNCGHVIIDAMGIIMQFLTEKGDPL